MDYEKKNKEVLEGVKKIHSGIKEVLAELGNSNLPLANILNEAVWALNKQFPELTESEDERIRKELLAVLEDLILPDDQRRRFLAYLEKQEDASKAIEAVDRIDRYIDEHLANAHDMKDSNPDKKYYRGWDDALGKMAGILQDVYSGEKQKEHQNNSDAPEKALGRDLTFPQDKDKNLDEIAQDYVDGVKEYNSEPTWDLMQTAVCYGYHYREQEEQKPSDLPAGFYFIDQDGNKYYSKEFRYNNGTFTTTMKVKEEQKPVEGKEYTSPDCGTSACCGDERFEIIEQAKRDIIEKTNIAENELSMELPLLDGILMRVWQVGWLNKKPAEWSEEDEKMKERIIDILNRTFSVYSALGTSTTRPSCPTYKDEIAWLKSIRPQPKVEWNEEAKEAKETIIAALTAANMTTDCKRRAKKWLQSLRPSWKPSEHQLSMLEAVILDPNNAGAESCHLALESLNEDLQKLIKI